MLVLLELGVQPIDDTLAGCLGADLAVEERLQGCKTMLDQRAKLADCRDDPGGRVGGRLGWSSGLGLAAVLRRDVGHLGLVGLCPGELLFWIDRVGGTGIQ